MIFDLDRIHFLEAPFALYLFSQTGHLLHALSLQIWFLSISWKNFFPKPSQPALAYAFFPSGVIGLCSNIAVPCYCERFVKISVIIIKPPLSLNHTGLKSYDQESQLTLKKKILTKQSLMQFIDHLGLYESCVL